MTTYRYSRWDGTQQLFDLDAADLMDSLSEDVLEHDDLDRAIRNMLQRGLNREGQRTEGLRDLLERLKKQRQQQLDRYNLDSLMDDLKDRLKDRLRDVVDTERAGIDRRLNEARRELEEAGDEGERLQAPMRLLEERAERGKETLDALPESTAGALLELKPESTEGHRWTA